MNNFYVTLPSNSSMDYFPKNTQSSFCTKLSSSLILSGGDWEVGLSEIFIPRSWFNVDQHNNGYQVIYDIEERVLKPTIVHEVKYTYQVGDNINNFCDSLNFAIQKTTEPEYGIRFMPDNENASRVLIEMEEGYEIHITKHMAPKLLYMLNLPNEDITINKRSLFTFRSTTQAPVPQLFSVMNENFKSVNEFLIPVTPIKPSAFAQTGKGLADVLNRNVKLHDLVDVVEFTYDSSKREMNINISENAEIRFTKAASSTLMDKFYFEEDTYLRGTHTIKVNSLVVVQPGDTMLLVIKEPHETVEVKRQTEHLTLNVGSYKKAESLFSAFKHIHLSQLPNSTVLMEVLPKYEVILSKGLMEMLGFERTTFEAGMHISKYPLELDAGITEIFVYSDVVSSHHVGDSFAPLLRVIPVMVESGVDKIVKHYQRPLYFPLRKTFMDSIEIELRTSFGSKITFMSGKTHVVLSFRRKKL